jgi:hypothetical protein
MSIHTLAKMRPGSNADGVTGGLSLTVRLVQVEYETRAHEPDSQAWSHSSREAGCGRRMAP